MLASPYPPHRELEQRAVGFALIAALLGEDTTILAGGQAVPVLTDLLQRIGEHAAAGALAPLVGWEGDPQVLAGIRVRWFEHGRLAPYEGSNTPPNASGVTPRLADVAGFYRAFGVTVRAERPDHVVAELEFLSLVLLREAAALVAGESEQADVCAGAIRSFLRDHLATWIEGWSARLQQYPELAPWTPVATAAAGLVRSEARRRNVVPLAAAGRPPA